MLVNNGFSESMQTFEPQYCLYATVNATLSLYMNTISSPRSKTHNYHIEFLDCPKK